MPVGDAEVYVKIPITNTRQESSIPLIATAGPCRRQVERDGRDDAGAGQRRLSGARGRAAGHRVGICRPHCGYRPGSRADHGSGAGTDPDGPNVELLWASPRELLNIFQADDVGCDIITATNDVLKKLELVGKDLDEFSLDTVKMFRDDAVKAGFRL